MLSSTSGEEAIAVWEGRAFNEMIFSGAVDDGDGVVAVGCVGADADGFAVLRAEPSRRSPSAMLLMLRVLTLWMSFSPAV